MKILLNSGFLIILLFVLLQTVSGQTENVSGEEKRWLRGDLRIADVVAYVDVKEIKFAGRSDDKTDCENNTQGGYCSYLLTADIKEIFKGNIKTKTLKFITGTDATYRKKGLLGEEIVFLVWQINAKTKKRTLVDIENSGRGTNWLKTMREIVNPQTIIDDNDEFETYSLKSLRKDFSEADAVIYADVFALAPFKDGFGSSPFFMQTKIIEVFKGDLKPKQTFKFVEDLLYRPLKKTDLGKQIIFLQKRDEDGKIYLERPRYTITEVRHGALEKLRQISQSN